MAARNPFGSRICLSRQAAIARAMAPSTRRLHRTVRGPHARPRPGISTALLVAAPRLTPTGPAGPTAAAGLAAIGPRRTSPGGVVAPTPLPKDQRLQSFERDLRLEQGR